jgi:hypothetical protein
MEVAAELDVTPWEAILKSVRLAAGRVAWVDEQLARAVKESTTAANDGDEPDGRVHLWLTESRKERTLLARFAKAAVDAGVAERQVRNAELEGQIIATVVGRVIDRLDLSPELRVTAFQEAHVALAALEDPNAGATTIEGTWTAFGDSNAPEDGSGGQGGAQPPSGNDDENG